MRFLKRPTLTLAVLTLLVASACGLHGGGNDDVAEGGTGTTTSGLDKLVVFQGTRGFPFLPLSMAESQGLFTARGLQVEVREVDGEDAIPRLAAGEADIGLTMPDFVIRSRAAGSSLRIIGSPVKENLFRLYAAPDVTTVADLAGKTLGMHHPGSAPDTQLRIALDSRGAGADKSTIVDSGGEPPVRLAALREKKITGTLLLPPFDSMAEQSGFRSLVTMKDLVPGYPNAVFSASEKTVTGKADPLRRFMSAIAEASRFIVDNPDAAIDKQAELSKAPREAMVSAYAFSKSAFSLDGSLSVEGLQRAIDVMKQYGGLRSTIAAKDLYDRSVLP